MVGGYVYKTTNLQNKKIYIGKHVGKFNKNYFGSGKVITKAIAKYGKDSFQLSILIQTKDKFKLDKLEKMYIKKYRLIFGKKKLYNISKGGEGGNNMVGPHKEKTKRKISMSLTGRKCPWIKGNKNPACRPEVREKNRLAHLGKKASLKTRRKMKKAWIGRIIPHRTKEHIKNLSLALKGRKSWCKGLTKETDKRLRRAGIKISTYAKNRSRKNGKFA